MTKVDLPDFTEDFIRVHGRLHANLPLEKDEDELSVILKGHLAVEELLRDIIKISVKHAKSIDDARFSFKQCLLLAKSLYVSAHNQWLWDELDKLNRIRNKLAHDLNSAGIKESVNEFIDICAKNGSGYVQSADALECSELAMAIIDVHHVLWEILKNNSK